MITITEQAASVVSRAAFYPSLLWNLARNKLQDTWHWWDEITEGVILGAIPFHSTLDQFKEMGVKAVVTLNEGFELFVTSEQYQELGFLHLHMPTVDFLYAPALEDLHRGADFIHDNAAEGGKTYVHCKAGRGRSTTVVLCYLIKYYNVDPVEAYEFVRDKRPQVCLAQGQWMAVCGFWSSCHPDQADKQFNHPKHLPIVQDKFGTDGPSEEAEAADGPQEVDDSAASDGDSATAVPDVAKSPDTVSCSGGGAAEAMIVEPPGKLGSKPITSKIDTGLDQTAAGTTRTSSEMHLDRNANGTHKPLSEPGRIFVTGQGEGTSPSASPEQPQDLDRSITELVTQLSSSQDGELVILGLRRDGYEREDKSSVGSLATVISTCCTDPRQGMRGAGHEESTTPHIAADIVPPERVSSPAITIRAAKQPVDAAEGNSSKTPITIEPSGSLPGYIRIAPTMSAPDLGKGPYAVCQPQLAAGISYDHFEPKHRPESARSESSKTAQSKFAQSAEYSDDGWCFDDEGSD